MGGANNVISSPNVREVAGQARRRRPDVVPRLHRPWVVVNAKQRDLQGRGLALAYWEGKVNLGAGLLRVEHETDGIAAVFIIVVVVVVVCFFFNSNNRDWLCLTSSRS